MPKLVVANWKEHPESIEEARALFSALKGLPCIVCPPFPFLEEASNYDFGHGAQDVSWEDEGPHTGEVSAGMLKAFGVTHVIVGHSERRALGETDAIINKKILKALREGLIPILCVGEPEAIHEKGTAAVEVYVGDELKEDLKGADPTKVIIAYEPIWAISTSGTGKTDTPADAADMIDFIKATLGVPDAQVLYGGSVSAENAESFLRVPTIGGVLVGGASLHPVEFKKIITYA